MKYSFLTCALLSFVFLMACKTDGIKDYDKDYNKEDCYEMVYPLTFSFPDGNSSTVADEDQMWTEMKAWYAAHPSSKEKVVYHYPMQLAFTNGEVKTVSNETEMIKAKKYCPDKDGN